MKNVFILNNAEKSKVFVMALFSIILSVFLAFVFRNDFSNTICFIAITIVFFTVFLYELNIRYLNKSEIPDFSRVILKLMLGYLAALLLVNAGYFFALKICLMFVVAIYFSMCFKTEIAVLLSGYLVLFATNAFSLSGAYLIEILFLWILGIVVGDIFKKVDNKILASFVTFTIMMMSLIVRRFALNSQYTVINVLTDMIIAFVEALMVLFIITILLPKERKMEVYSYSEILDEKFSMVILMKNLSFEKYTHCRIVAHIVYDIATRLSLKSLDANLASAAAFYYSLCDNDEENPIEYAVMLAKQNSVPTPVLDIMHSYQGVLSPIVTKEGALCDLVDSIITSFENSDDVKEFDREVLVHRLFNDLSLSGRYDESGLSMNSYLRIRDELIKEVSRIDNLS